MNRFSIIQPTFLSIALALLAATTTGCIVGTAVESEDSTTSELVSALPYGYASANAADDSEGGHRAINTPGTSNTRITSERPAASGGEDQGPHPDPWLLTAGPHPDPWSGGSTGGSSNSSSSGGSTGKR